MCFQSHFFLFLHRGHKASPPASRVALGTTVESRARVAHARIARAIRKLPRQTNKRLDRKDDNAEEWLEEKQTNFP